MREPILFLALRRALSQTARSWFRVVHFSVQADHVHMIVEAADKTSLSRGMAGLSVRLARAFNAVLGRRGALWGRRYHARPLKTPREVRNGLVYVLMNRRKHIARSAMSGKVSDAKVSDAKVSSVTHIDPCSSAWWFEGWDRPPSSEPPWSMDGAPVAPPETWLARIGWKRHGLIGAHESPKRDGRRH
jgi:hypothetical protein